jgi:hypothetical protein
MAEQDDWEDRWDERERALEEVLGPVDGVFHSPVPFELGGQADVLVFRAHLEGVVYVTADLSGPADERHADYELMIVQRDDGPWGPNVISRLAPYTQEAFIAAGESMDIDDATPASSLVKAFVFDTYDRFKAFRQEFDLRLCVGITKEELAFKVKFGADALLARLKAAGVYPYTDLARGSVLLGD